jgi:hypothetical protein
MLCHLASFNCMCSLEKKGLPMYGVPANLDPSTFVGQELIQVAIGAYDLQFHFHPELTISIQGHWELRDSTGTVVEHAGTDDDEGLSRIVATPTSLPHLIGQSVTKLRISPPEWFEIEFDSGECLRVFDDSPQNESFSIHPPGIYV